MLPGTLLRNDSLRFICKSVPLKVNTHTKFTSEYPENVSIHLPVAHGEGNYYCDEKTLKELKEKNQIVFTYQEKVNGSLANIAGICNEQGNVLGKMCIRDRKNTKEAVQLMSPSELTTLNTSVLLDFPDAIVQTAAFEGLYSLDEQDQLVPAVAKALPTISEDGKTYTISLRKEAVWSNDDPVTAHDFEYAWKKMIDPKNGFVYSFLIVETIQNGAEISAGKLAPNELGVTAVDDYTLKVTLKEPKPYFTSLLAFPTFFPQNQKVVEQFGADYGTASDKVVYNGPVSYTHLDVYKRQKLYSGRY